MKDLTPTFLAGMMTFTPFAAYSQAYPTRPLRLVVAVAQGAGADATARAIGQMLSARLGQNVVIDNRPGNNSVAATELVAQSTPDGYTMLNLGETLMLLGATKRVPFDVLKAFDPLVAATAQPYIQRLNNVKIR